MTNPVPDMWECPNSTHVQQDYFHCIMCNVPRLGAILPSGSSTKGRCIINKNHPAAIVAARVGGGGHPLKGPLQPLKQPPSRARDSPHHGTKVKAIESMKQQNAHTPRVPVAKVVQLPVSSPSKPLADPTVARAGMGVIDLAGNESDSEDDGSPCTAPRISGSKTTGLEDTNVEESPLFPFSPPNTPSLPTDNEVSTYLFFNRLAHYLEGNRISKANRTAVELCIFIEAGAAVRGMDAMYKQKKEAAFFSKYMEVLDEIKEDQFVCEDIRNAMHHRYKAAKADNTGKSLWRKYESELMLIWNFAEKNPRVGSLSKLPSGSNKLKHMKMPLVQALWMEKHPVEFFLFFLLLFLHKSCQSNYDNIPSEY
jgi:hypothetical protein